MSPKDLIIDFINVVFLIVLVAFMVFYFIVGDRFGAFIEIMRSLIPLSFFAIMFLAAMKIRRSELKRAKKQGEENMQTIIRLTIFDRIKADAVAFTLPVIVLGIAFFLEGIIVFFDIIQAIIVFLMVYFWNRYLFNKAEN